jgi:hypothetical protein
VHDISRGFRESINQWGLVFAQVMRDILEVADCSDRWSLLALSSLINKNGLGTLAFLEQATAATRAES